MKKTKIAILFILVLSIMMFTTMFSFADLYDYNKDNSTTIVRMKPILKRYNGLTEAEIAAQTKKYVDTQGHFGEKYIARLAALEIIVGDGVSKFNPNDTLLACQYLKMIVMAIGYTPEIVPGGSWWTPFIEIALDEGIIEKGEIKDYTKPITRELAGVIGFRTLMKYKERPEGQDEWYNYNKSKISDYMQISEKYRDDVVMAYRMGVITGSNNLYVPKGTLTRAQAAIIVNRLIDDTLRVESVPKPEEAIVYKRRENMNPRMFSYKPGEVYTIYPGDFPLNEIYDVFKAMNDNINVGDGYREIIFTGVDHDTATEMFESKEDADYFYTKDSRLLKSYCLFSIVTSNCFEKDLLNHNGSGFLYNLFIDDSIRYNKQMKDYAYKIFEVLFEQDAKTAIKLHDDFLTRAIKGERIEVNIYYLNNRQVAIFGGGGGLEIQIWAKNSISKNNLFKP